MVTKNILFIVYQQKLFDQYKHKVFFPKYECFFPSYKIIDSKSLWVDPAHLCFKNIKVILISVNAILVDARFQRNLSFLIITAANSKISHMHLYR